ncbi:MAG: ROK family protein [Chloroflexales bacterium]|nr:ROK family protein [Chloroflexales bacterium]
MTSKERSGAVYGGIEAGGTKWVCAIGTGPDDVRAEMRFATTAPDETIARAVAFFRDYQRTEVLAAIGVGSFGPVDLALHSPTYGFITSTPKSGWMNTDVVGGLQKAFAIPIAFDTDVNAAALAEYRWGAAQGCDIAIYMTIGTGIGGGAVVNNSLLHGLLHPEMGHMRLPHDMERDPFPGACPFHGDCLEGLASGPALAQRWGQPAEQLPADHPAWPLQAHYLALALVNLICILSPQRIVLGGGVMDQPQLIGLVQREVQQTLNGYIRALAILDDIARYIVTPGLGNRAGVLGAIALAARAISV